MCPPKPLTRRTHNTTLWGDSIPTPGLAWDSVFAVALGAQYELTDRVTLRMGYLANENPIPDVAMLFNVQLPTISRHQISVGGGCKLTPSITSDLAIVYGFKNSISSTIPLPGGGGPVGVDLSQELISASFGLRFKF
jgi:long-chain fatty acid transport protein